MIKDPKVPLKVKMKKCLYATGVVAVTVFWIKEMYKYKTKDYISPRPTIFGKRSNGYMDIDDNHDYHDSSNENDEWMTFQ